MSYLRKRGTGESVKPGFAAYDSAFVGRYPAIHEFLTRIEDDEGKPRKTASLTLFSEDGSFKACLSDRELNEVCFVTADAFMELLDGLEHDLQEGKCDWRRVSGGRGRSR